MMENGVILITGGTRGIGRAIALRMAREKPAHLTLCYSTNYPAARRTATEVEALGVAVSIVPTDVSRPALMRELFDGVLDAHGRLDVFVSNAARASFNAVDQTTEKGWKRTMELNAGAFLIGSQMAAEIMKEQGSGAIVGLSSLGSQFAIPGYAALGAAKAAIEALTRYLAAELAPSGIRVNAVSGGFVDTESMRLGPDYEKIKRYVAERAPAGRVATPEDLAGVVAFLCSADAAWIHGQTLIADGGLSLVL